MAGGGALAPFDQHGADLGLLEESAAALVRLSNQAIDQEAATLAAFNPAIDGWDGVAAPELRAAPEPVRQDAFEASSALAWGSVPLRTWAAKVAEFNRKAAEYEGECTAQLSALTMPADPAGSPSTALAVDSARATTRMHWERLWREAHEQYIVDGAAEVARMYREGPTEENLEAAGLAGIPYAASGALAVLPALWHDVNMREQATRAVNLANRILRDVDPSERDLARLDALLREYGGDEAFAYHLLTGLGPRGLLELTADVALFDRDYDEPGAIDNDLASLVGSIQAGLGVVLATGTRPRTANRYEIDEDWRQGLLDAAEERIEIDRTDWQPYGYHLLGVLLSSPEANFGSDFLAEVGGGMIDFELAHDLSGTWGVGGLDMGVRLNWVNGYGEDAPFGEDPMISLMSALSHDRDAAHEFFTTRSTVDGDEVSRVRYLMSERYWWPDSPYFGSEEPGAASGPERLGHALAVASTHPDAAPLVTEIVLTTNEHGLVDDSMRAPLAGVVEEWIDGMYNVMRGGDRELELDEIQVASFLEELGRDERARDTVVIAATNHGIHTLDAAFDRGEQHRTMGVLLPTAEIMRALDVGYEQTEIEGLERHHRQVENLAQAGRNALDLAGTSGALIGLGVDYFGLDDAIVERFGGDPERIERERLEIQSGTRDALEAIYWAVVADHGGPTGHDDVTTEDDQEYAETANIVSSLYVLGRQAVHD